MVATAPEEIAPAAELTVAVVPVVERMVVGPLVVIPLEVEAPEALVVGRPVDQARVDQAPVVRVVPPPEAQLVVEVVATVVAEATVVQLPAEAPKAEMVEMPALGRVAAAGRPLRAEVLERPLAAVPAEEQRSFSPVLVAHLTAAPRFPPPLSEEI